MGESLLSGRQRLIVPLHSSLGNKSKTISKKKEREKRGKGQNLGARQGWCYMAEAQEGFKEEQMVSSRLNEG